MWGQQREVFPGLDSGPNGSEGHYFYTLEKRPSADPTYTTYTIFQSQLYKDIFRKIVLVRFL